MTNALPTDVPVGPSERRDEVGEQLAALRARLTSPGARWETVEEVIRGARLPTFKERSRSLRQILDASSRYGDRTYIVDGDVRISYRGHIELVDAVAVALQREYGVSPGDRVAIYAANRWEWIVAFWAVTSVGAIPAAFNGWWTHEEYEHAVRLVKPVLVFGDEQRLDRAGDHDRAIVRRALGDLPAMAARHVGECPDLPEVAEDDPALLVFTSGTTGRPKAVNVPQRSACGFVDVNSFSEALGRVAAGAPVPRAGDLAEPADDVVLVTAPLFHVSMLQGAIVAVLVKGGALVLLPGRLEPEHVLATIERERVSQWAALGSAAPRVSGSDAVGKYDTSSLKVLGVGGAPVSPAVQSALRRAFPSASASLGMGYTSTEGGAVIAAIGGAEFASHPTSTGRVAVTTEIEIRGEGGEPLPEGEYGLVHVRSPYLMLGYWDDPEASSAVLKEDSWLAMGDVGRLEGGLLYIDSRARDMILVSAENVSPTEVEYVLEAHPAVQESAVFAVDDEVTGDAVCAVVTVTTPTSTSELDAWCRGQLARYKVPTRWYVSADPLPRTASGKLLKSALREQVDTGLLQPAPSTAEADT